VEASKFPHKNLAAPCDDLELLDHFIMPHFRGSAKLQHLYLTSLNHFGLG
jgi:hypothetical protein